MGSALNLAYCIASIQLWAQANVEGRTLEGGAAGAEPTAGACHMSRVGQNHIYTVYIRYFWQGNYKMYGHIRCIYIRFWPTLHMSLCVYVCACICVRVCRCCV
jgi:hypothetical protein